MNKTNLQENPMNLVCLFICRCSSPISFYENCVKSCVSIDPTQLSHQIDHRRPVVSHKPPWTGQRVVIVDLLMDTVSSSAERGIMCDKILSPDTLNVDMGDFVWNNTASCKCRIWNEVQLISVCCPSLHFWLVPNKIFWSWNWRAPIWWAVCVSYSVNLNCHKIIICVFPS